MIVYGASGHGKVLIDLIRSTKIHNVDLVVDDNPDIQEILGIPVLQEVPTEFLKKELVFAIGNNKIRHKLACSGNFNFCRPLIHNKAVIAEEVSIGNGSVIMANSTINSDTKIGEHSIINTGSIVEHDVKIGNFCHISPGAVITGNVKVGKGTHIGAAAVIIPGISIGKWVTIGAGAVIIEDVPDFATVVGNPGRIVKFNEFRDE